MTERTYRILLGVVLIAVLLIGWNVLLVVYIGVLINSTMSHLVPLYMLKQAGVGLKDLAAHEFPNKHENVALIAQGDIAKVFDVFRRVGRQDQPGDGMGLAYVKALVKRLDGRIWCESEEGKGSVFSFALPKAEGATRDAHEEQHLHL